MRIRRFRARDYDRVRALWERSGLRISPGDDRRRVVVKLRRDPELFLVAEENGEIVGSVWGAWDGRRGWLYHLGVDPTFQRRGVGRRLVEEVERRMVRRGVVKVNALVYETNGPSLAFFRNMGYTSDRTILHHGKLLRALP